MSVPITGFPDTLIDDAQAWPGASAPYDYQQWMLQWLMRWYLTESMNGRISNVVTVKAKPGAGKTRICMAMARVLRDQAVTKAFPAEVETVTLRQWSGSATAVTTKRAKLARPAAPADRPYVVVAVPTGSALEDQWKAQLGEFGGDLRVQPFFPRASFKAKVEGVRDGAIDVIIVRTSMIGEWKSLAEEYELPPPRAVFIDEAPGMGNSGMGIPCGAYVNLSATPDEESERSELIHVLEVPDEVVDRSIVLPAPVVADHLAIIQERDARVWRELPDDLRESLEAGDIGRVAAAMRIDVAGGVDAIRARLLGGTAATLRAAEADLAMWRGQLAALAEGGGAALPDDQLAAEQLRLEAQVAGASAAAKAAREAHEALRDRLEGALAECAACADEDPVGPVFFPCSHGMCSECFARWVGRRGGDRVTCPTCHAAQRTEDCVAVLPEGAEAPDQPAEPRTKREHLAALIQQELAQDGGRVVVFTTTVNGTDSFRDVAARAVDDPNIVAKCAKSADVVRRFAAGDVRVLLLDAQNMAEGLELQCATALIITGPLDPLVERQVVGRCQRVGRENPLRIHWILNQMEAAKDKTD